jgi:hypothetical protein
VIVLDCNSDVAASEGIIMVLVYSQSRVSNWNAGGCDTCDDTTAAERVEEESEVVQLRSPDMHQKPDMDERRLGHIQQKSTRICVSFVNLEDLTAFDLSIIFDMLDRIHNLIDQLHCYAWNNSLGVREGSLKGTESHSSLLCRDSRKELSTLSAPGG